MHTSPFLLEVYFMNHYDDLAIIILAAGKGTRMKSDLAKVLHKVAGKSMVNHVIECARHICPDHIHVVVGHQAEQVKERVTQRFQVRFSIQEHLLGTGDAVKSALPHIDKHIDKVLVLCGDVPLIQKDTLKSLIDGHRNSHAAVTVLATDVENPTGYGRLILDSDGRLLCIREEADASTEEKAIKTVNTGIYCFDKAFLKAAVQSLQPDNNQEEYYLTDVIKIAKENDHPVSVVAMDDPRQVIGVNTLEELGIAERLIRHLRG